ncbi:hypothetical protein KM043_017113 [Ampulex compressa]|nr:hypothetical protein KM043_017113 [Ampulex compressa]
MDRFLRLFGIHADNKRIDQATGLTEKQKELVQNTWRITAKEEFGVAMMLAFFKRYPAYQRYFAAFKDIPLDELSSNKRFQAHCANVVLALNNVINSLHDPGLMEAELMALGEKHKKRGQTKAEFQNLQGVIFEVLPQALGKQFTPDVAEAWGKAMDGVFSTIYRIYVDEN